MRKKHIIAAEVYDALPKSILRLFWLFARPYAVPIVGLIICAMGLRSISVFLVNAIKNVVDVAVHLQAGGDTQPVYTAFYALLALVALSIVVEWVAWTCSYFGRIRALARGRHIMFSYVQRHNTTYFDNTLTGKVSFRILMLPDQMMGLYEKYVWDYLPFIAQCSVSLYLFFQVSPIFAGVMLVWLVIYGVGAYSFGRRIERFGRLNSEARATLTGRVVDAITNIKNIAFFAAEKTEDIHIGQAISGAYKAQKRQYREFIRMRLPLQQGMLIILYTLIFPLVLQFLVAGRMTAGEFLMISTLILTISRNVADIANGLPDTFDTLGSIRESMDTLIVSRPLRDSPTAKPLAVTAASLTLQEVRFTYDEQKTVFDKLNLHIPQGQKVGLIGASGAGKTTLMALLMRFYDLNSGAILIDGQNIADVTQESLRRAMGIIPQESMLFHRSLLENIRYGRPEASDDDVIEAAKRAYAHDFIMTLPQGYNTLVGERGVKLSGGQRQRVAIARAILKNAPILILDEATSALDSESEAAVQAAMQDVMQGKTVIAIAHRLSTIAHLDRLIVLDKGCIVEDGTHAQLLAQQGLYAKLWQRQSGGFLTDTLEAEEAEHDDQKN